MRVFHGSYMAVDVLYNSKTFSQLSDKTTNLYQKQWTEIYNMLKNERDGLAESP